MYWFLLIFISLKRSQLQQTALWNIFFFRENKAWHYMWSRRLPWNSKPYFLWQKYDKSILEYRRPNPLSTLRVNNKITKQECNSNIQTNSVDLGLIVSKNNFCETLNKVQMFSLKYGSDFDQLLQLEKLTYNIIWQCLLTTVCTAL